MPVIELMGPALDVLGTRTRAIGLTPGGGPQDIPIHLLVVGLIPILASTHAAHDVSP